MAWLAAASAVVKLVELGINLVERSQTTAKGGDKADLARMFAAELAKAGCQTSSKALESPSNELEEAIKQYQNAYVKLQNVLAKENHP